MTQTRHRRTDEQVNGRAAGHERASGRGTRPAKGRPPETEPAGKRPGGARGGREVTAGGSAGQHKRRKKKRGIIAKVFLVSVVFAILAGLGCLAVAACRLKRINVTSNQLTSAEEMTAWIGQDRYSNNTLYVWWKYNRADVSAFPAVESIHVKINSFQEVTVEVTEKTFIGRMDMNGEFLYFDKKGIVSYKSADVLEGVPLIDGMGADMEKAQVGEVLPVSDKSVFEKIEEISDLLAQNELKPDRIEISETGLALWFGGVNILLGDGRYAARIEQIPPILERLNELYPGQNGVLHLENYGQGTEFIRFEPERG